MAPKTKYTREFIIDTAFEIARVEGIDQITIRKVAQKMGSSIAPIYVNFTEIDELKKEVLKKIHDIAQEMLVNEYSPDPFLNIGIASIKFARENPVLFKDLLNNNHYLDDVQPDMSGLLSQMQRSSKLQDLNEQELMEIMFKMQVFQLGLSVMDVHGMLPKEFDEENMIALLGSAAADVITTKQSRKQDK